MDIRRTGFFGYLTQNGKPIELHTPQGSPMSLVAEMLKSLTLERSRLTPDGDQEILLRIRNKPLDTGKEATLILGKAEEVGALLDSVNHTHGESDTPRENETYETFYERLIQSDYPPVAAEYIAASWFNREINPATTLWLNDPKAVRFRELNSRDEAFEAALPSEYESLKNYVKTTYPEFIAGLTFRTA